jgi:hypothetical protein
MKKEVMTLMKKESSEGSSKSIKKSKKKLKTLNQIII